MLGCLDSANMSSNSTYTMKISVEKDLRTGESHILSTATIAPLDLQQQGIKVYDDGHKSVYALPPDGRDSQNDMNEMSLLEVEELLMKKEATSAFMAFRCPTRTRVPFRLRTLPNKKPFTFQPLKPTSIWVESGEPVTMIFMGYQNVESDEEDEGIQAELVVISDDDDDEDSEEATLSYHPLELNALQLQKTHANRKSTSKSRKHLHLFDNKCAANTQNTTI
uniref:Uncharacterized protein n=1 Tax=Cyprinus carpio TaxID=7962 RepID=A0A8C1UUA9_CYPCA